MQQCDCAGMHPPEESKTSKQFCLQRGISCKYSRNEATFTTWPSLLGILSVPNLSHGDGNEPFQLLITDTGREGVKVHNN